MVEIFWKEGTIATLEGNGASWSSGTALEANDATLDVRASGLSGVVQNLDAQCELVCQWATVTGIVAGVVIAELYLVPALDGTNYPDLDLTATTSFIPYPHYAGNFIASKAPSSNTDMRCASPVVRLRPWLYKAYVLNRSGQTVSAGWTLKVMSARLQAS